jgi:hypothetical protein
VVASPNADCFSPGTVSLVGSPTVGRLSRTACPRRIRTTRIPHGDRPLGNPPVINDHGPPEGCPKPRFALPERAFRSVMAVVSEWTARCWVPCARWVHGAPTVAPARMRRLKPVAPDGRARPCPLHPQRCGGRDPLRPDGHAFPGLGCPRGHVEPGPSCSARRPVSIPGSDQPDPPSRSATPAKVRWLNILGSEGTPCSVSCDPKARGGELVSCPEDTVPPCRCSPKTARGLMALRPMNTRPSAPVRPVAHDGLLAVRPMSALLPRRCGPKTARGWQRCVRWTRCRPSAVTRRITGDGVHVPVGHLGLERFVPMDAPNQRRQVILHAPG